MRELLREHAAPPPPPAAPGGRSVLSVGAGTGHFDADLLAAVLPDVTRWVGVEPNAAQAARLRAAMAGLPPAVARRLAAPPEVREAPFDAAFVAAALAAGERHDLVLFTHCLYHMDPPAAAVAMALPLLRPRGRVAVLNQTDEGMCALVRRFRPRWAFVDRERGAPCPPLADHCLSVEALAAALEARGDARRVAARVHVRDSGIDLRPFCGGGGGRSPAREAALLRMLTFFAQVRVAELPAGLRDELVLELERRAAAGGGWLRHPTGLLVAEVRGGV